MTVQLVLAVVGMALILLTVLSALPGEAWWVRMGDFPRSQVTVLAVFTLLGYAAVREPRGMGEMAFLGALGASVAWQLRMMLPYTKVWPVQVQRARRPEEPGRITLLIANVLQTNRESKRLRELLDEARPDVVLLVETDQWWLDQMGHLSERLPNTVLVPLDNTYGMLLFSRLELADARVEYLVEPDIPSIHVRVRMESGTWVELHCVHPRPPAPGENDRSTERDAELLLVGRKVCHKRGPVIVAGDLNDVAWSHTTRLFQKVSGLLDPRIGRGFFNTFHAKNPLVRWPLDHVFHSRDFRVVRLERLPAFGSDHFPVCITLSHEPDAVPQHEHPRADAEEQQEATEKIVRALNENDGPQVAPAV